MKVQLKYILPYSVLTSPDFLIFLDLTVYDLKHKISEIFNIPHELVILKIKREGYFVKIFSLHDLNFLRLGLQMNSLYPFMKLLKTKYFLFRIVMN